MNAQHNVEVVRQAYEAFGRGDVHTLLDLFDESIEWAPRPPDRPTAENARQALEQVRDFVRAVDDVFEMQRFEPKTFIAQGESVVVLGDETPSVTASGRVLDEPWAHVFTLRNGKIVTFQEYLGTASVVAELQAAHARTVAIENHA